MTFTQAKAQVEHRPSTSPLRAIFTSSHALLISCFYFNPFWKLPLSFLWVVILATIQRQGAEVLVMPTCFLNFHFLFYPFFCLHETNRWRINQFQKTLLKDDFLMHNVACSHGNPRKKLNATLSVTVKVTPQKN